MNHVAERLKDAHPRGHVRADMTSLMTRKSPAAALLVPSRAQEADLNLVMRSEITAIAEVIGATGVTVGDAAGAIHAVVKLLRPGEAVQAEEATVGTVNTPHAVRPAAKWRRCPDPLHQPPLARVEEARVPMGREGSLATSLLHASMVGGFVTSLYLDNTLFLNVGLLHSLSSWLLCV